MAISFVTNKVVPVDGGDLRLRAARLAFERIPVSPAAAPSVRHIRRIVTASAGPGGLSATEREDAQAALDKLQASNISFQLATITTRWAQNVPAACRVGLASRNPDTFKVYVFWVPWLAAEPYIWLNMDLRNDPGTFSLGTTQPVLPGGRLTKNGRTVNRLSVDTTLLARYGPEQAKKGHQILVDHGRAVLALPGATCQVLKNGSLRLLPT